MSDNSQLACDAKVIWKCFCGDQGQMMAALIAIFAKIAGVTVDCPTLNGLSSQFACLPRQAQLPALIWLASQIVAAQIVPAGSGFVTQGIGPPTSPPPTPVGFYVDNTTPRQPALWNWNGTTWNEMIA